MKTLDQFISETSGKPIVNNGGTFPGECVSLAARYAQEVQGVPNADAVLYCSKTGGARDLYEVYDGQIPKYYDRIPYGQPRKYGDLIVWGANLGQYGDVAIVLDGGNRVYGQLGTPVFKPATIREESRSPLGYLRLKRSVIMPNEGAIVNLYQTVNDRPATAQEVAIYKAKDWNDPEGLLYGKAIPDIKHLRSEVQKYADGSNYATSVANARGDRLNAIAQEVGAKDSDDIDTIMANIKALKAGSGQSSELDKENNSILKWIKDKLSFIFK